MRRIIRRCKYTALGLAMGVIGMLVLSGITYHGPRHADEMHARMPGVPIFPLSVTAPANSAIQVLMSPAMHLLRWQGATRADIMALRAPADEVFIAEWYRAITPTQQWTLISSSPARGVQRLLYFRDREGLQVSIGKTRGLHTPVQVLYVQDMTDAQLRRIDPTYRARSPQIARVRSNPWAEVNFPDLTGIDPYEPFRIITVPPRPPRQPWPE